MQKENIDIIAVDNCCQWRWKLKDVFGERVRVVLDVFHAVQRVAKKIPKRHPYYYSCIQDLTLVFRQLSDHGLNRCQDTPNPLQLINNLQSFKDKWRTVEKKWVESFPSTSCA